MADKKKKRMEAIIWINFVTGKDLFRKYELDMGAILDIIEIRYDIDGDGNVTEEQLEAIKRKNKNIKTRDIRCLKNGKVKELESDWANMERDDILTELISLQEEGFVEDDPPAMGCKDNTRSKVKIPNLTYDGTEDWECFENALRAHKDLFVIEGSDMLYILSIILKGNAASTFTSFVTTTEPKLRNFENLMGKLRDRFGNVNLASAAYLQLRQAKQRDSETEKEYESRLWGLCAKALGNANSLVMDKEVRISFLSGLTNKKMKEFLILREPKDMSEVKLAISLWEHAQEMVGKSKREVNFEKEASFALDEDSKKGNVWEGESDKKIGRDPILDTVERMHKEFMIEVRKIADSIEKGMGKKSQSSRNRDDSYERGDRASGGSRSAKWERRDESPRRYRRDMSRDRDYISERSRSNRRGNYDSRFRSSSRDSSLGSQDRVRNYGRKTTNRNRDFEEYGKIRDGGSKERKMVCFECGKLGHISTNCPVRNRSPDYRVKKQCGYCDKDHLTLNCPMKRNDICRICGDLGHHGYECDRNLNG